VVEKFRKIFGSSLLSLNEVALVLGLSAIASQILALIRDRIFAYTFGTGRTLDIYYAAFKIPDFLFVTVASLVSMTVLIPYFTREYNNNKEGAKIFLDSVFTVFFWMLIVSAIITFFLIPKLSYFVAPGFSLGERLEFIKLSRALLFSPLFLGLSGHIASIVQSFKKFFVYALSPVLYNVGIIIGILFFYPHFGLMGLAMGVILGSIFHFAIQWPTAKATGFAPSFTRKILWPKVREVLLVSVPRTLTLGSAQLAAILITSFASFLSAGSIAVYNLAFNLQSVPLSIIGVSFSMAAFPTLSALFAVGKKESFIRELSQAARQIIFWSLPATALFIVLRAQIVRTIFGSGRFDWTSTRLVAAALAIFAISLVAQGLVFLFVRGYYATGRTRAPLYSNIVSAIIIVALAPSLLYLYSHIEIFRYFIQALLRVTDVPGTEILMLPLAYSIGIIVNMILHWYFFSREFGFLPVFSTSLRHPLYTAILSGSVAYGGLAIFDGLFNLDTLSGIFLQGFLSGTLGIISGVALLYLLKNEEFSALISALGYKFWRSSAILPPPEDLPQ